MADKNTWRTVCLDAGDESGDVIIELPAELLDKLGWSVGDQLVVEKTDDLLLLKLKPRTSRTVQTDP
ncbi:AbrB/MazE/SpoVT family DNA-binding domain-containing protein [Pseudomonas aeruginosa]|uniref:AbrB/MazE/SpoVT family DNA-binding domain-containing protein n=1 Tax=Ectopseudomonas oleovorans TaxID=301 RepID=A0AA42TWK0_ECTOL|nr:AbrB/MazE/SpoVT family DNA-binding domain-containing protein [Pseudomonas oleovorans]MDH1338866.1 AbrB/MazE/SpoVT family DNA-binding domain-containing protein [Pseudomonas oleovorans]MDH1492142.1 AbrB/MazE/SpoVT family DNA-binding domain-containing protein [Pseudomonas oleovorans]WGG20772.1 AbrB/MazE/SpoVT family DNA-binding domain-containing protein [Pseudomonas oleovorans]